MMVVVLKIRTTEKNKRPLPHQTRVLPNFVSLFIGWQEDTRRVEKGGLDKILKYKSTHHSLLCSIM